MHEHAELISVERKFFSWVGKPRFTLAALYVYSVCVAAVTVVPVVVVTTSGAVVTRTLVEVTDVVVEVVVVV